MSRCLAVALALGVAGWTALADQRDAELPALFTALGEAPDPQAAYAVEQAIWTRWLEGPAPEADELLERARGAVAEGGLVEAIATLDELTARFPEFAEAWNQRAIVHFLARDFESSLADIERTLALEPRHFGALAGRGQCHFNMERYRDALQAFEAALQIHPWLPAARQQSNMLKMMIGAEPEAI